MRHPQPRSAIPGAKALAIRKALLTFNRNAQSMVSASTSPVGAAISVPPLLTRMSTSPEGILSPLDQPRQVGVLEVVGHEDRLPTGADYLLDHPLATLL